jgi:hypothetical protein
VRARTPGWRCRELSSRCTADTRGTQGPRRTESARTHCPRCSEILDRSWPACTARRTSSRPRSRCRSPRSHGSAVRASSSGRSCTHGAEGSRTPARRRAQRTRGRSRSRSSDGRCHRCRGCSRRPRNRRVAGPFASCVVSSNKCATPAVAISKR